MMNKSGFTVTNKEYKLTEDYTTYLSRLALPLAYASGQKESCFHSGATEWTDYGRMRWSKPRAWRVYLRYRSIKPPCTNRGVSHSPISVYNDEIPYYWTCAQCGRLANLGDFDRCTECIGAVIPF